MHSLQPFYIVQIHQIMKYQGSCMTLPGIHVPQIENHHSTTLKLHSLEWKDSEGSDWIFEMWCSVPPPSWGKYLIQFPAPFLIHRIRTVLRMTMLAGDQLLWRKTVLNQKLWKVKHILREQSSTLESQQNGDREGYIWPRTCIYSNK